MDDRWGRLGRARATGDWAMVVALLAQQAKEEPPGERQLGLLRELAEVAEEQLADTTLALNTRARMLELDAADLENLAAMGRICTARAEWMTVCSLRERAAELETDPARLAALLSSLERLCREQLGDDRKADVFARRRADLTGG